MKFLIVMAISSLVKISDAATPALQELEQVMTHQNIAANIGEAETILFQNHFAQLGPNKNGWPTTAFWPRAARAVNWQAFPQSLVISVNQIGVRQRYLGGEIHPTAGHKYLTIPARAEAYGKLAGEFSNLKVAFSRGHAFALVEADATKVSFGRKRKDGTRKVTQGDTIGGGVMFWLVKSVYQNPDPTVLPSDEQIQATAVATVNDLAARIGNGGQA
jgi:hypothetical protein